MESQNELTIIEQKARRRKITQNTVIYALLTIWGLCVLFPFYWMVLSSVKSYSEYSSEYVPKFYTAAPTLQNYIDAFTAVNLGRYLLNTLLFTLITTGVMLVVTILAAYAFAKLKFPGRDIIFVTLLAVLMVPSSFFILPQYLIIQKLGLLNTIPALFIPNLFSAFGTFLLRQFFMSLPSDLEDAAALDGCNPFMTYWKIMLPLAKPGLVSLGILTLRFAWNDLMWPLIVNTSQDKMTLTAGLAYMQGQYQTNFPEMMAGAMMAIIPLLVLFAIFQKQFIEGIALTGIKG